VKGSCDGSSEFLGWIITRNLRTLPKVLATALQLLLKVVARGQMQE